MMKIVTKTKLSPQEAVRQAVEFFGPAGQGLEIKRHEPECAYLEGGGGGVEITACTEGKQTSLEIDSREWDYQVGEFIRKLH